MLIFGYHLYLSSCLFKGETIMFKTVRETWPSLFENVDKDMDRLLQATIGFDRMFNQLDTFLQNTPPSKTTYAYPPSDLERLSDTDYRLTLAVAGFKKEDIRVEKLDNVLRIVGKQNREEVKEDISSDTTSLIKAEPRTAITNFIYKGIAARSFTREFTLDRNVSIKNAKLEDGLLTIDLYHDVPKVKEPIPISIE